MSVSTLGPLRKTLKETPASRVLIIQVILGVATITVVWTTQWRLAFLGLVLMHVFTALAALGPWGGRPVPPPAPRPTPGPAPASKVQLAALDKRVDELGERLASKAKITSLEQRVDGLGARLVASTERTRVEVLDALAQARLDTEERQH